MSERLHPGIFNIPDPAPPGGFPQIQSGEGWIGEGELSRWTESVRGLVKRHLSQTPTFEEVASLCSAVHAFRKVAKPPEEIIPTYCRRSADEIISSSQVYVLGRDESDKYPRNFPSVSGCMERALTVATALRCGGLPAIFTRFGTHSTARFILNGELYEYGRLHEPGKPYERVVKLFRGQRMIDQSNKAEGIYREGLDPAAIGMHSIRDFWICRGPSNEPRLFEETYGHILGPH